MENFYQFIKTFHVLIRGMSPLLLQRGKQQQGGMLWGEEQVAPLPPASPPPVPSFSLLPAPPHSTCIAAAETASGWLWHLSPGAADTDCCVTVRGQSFHVLRATGGNGVEAVAYSKQQGGGDGEEAMAPT